MTYIGIDGRTPDARDVEERLSAEVGPFTAMQLRSRRIRGFETHLARLERATRALHSETLDTERVLRFLEIAVSESAGDATIRIEVYAIESRELRVLVRASAPQRPDDGPETLRSVRYVRPLPTINHLDGGAQRILRADARSAGLGDALLCTDDGQLLETTSANIGFVSRGRILWPDGPSLAGTTQHLVTEVFKENGVTVATVPVNLTDLDSFDAVFVTNAVGVRPVERIDGVRVPFSAESNALVSDAFCSVPLGWVHEARSIPSPAHTMSTPVTTTNVTSTGATGSAMSANPTMSAGSASPM